MPGELQLMVYRGESQFSTSGRERHAQMEMETVKGFRDDIRVKEKRGEGTQQAVDLKGTQAGVGLPEGTGKLSRS